MIKVPATKEGITCIEQLIGDGLNINVTLCFRAVPLSGSCRGLSPWSGVQKGGGWFSERITSVASFFLSRIDVLLDPILKNIKRDLLPGADIADRVFGKVAIASAKCAHMIYKEIFESERFDMLRKEGARPQHLLWASTSTKEPEFSDIKYVEALIGPETVTRLPSETLDAYRDHGRPELRLTLDMDEARLVLDSLAELDISLDRAEAQQLEKEGIDKFIKAYDSLPKTLKKVGSREEEANIELQTFLPG